MRREIWIGFAWMLAIPGSMTAEPAERPGLRARYSSVGTAAIDRVDETISFDWRSSRPDVRLPAGPFSAQWEGILFVAQPGRHRLSLFVEGDITVWLDDKRIVQGSPISASWMESEPIDLSFGNHPLRIVYNRTGTSGRIHLHWSSDFFEREAIPATRLRHLSDESDDAPPVTDLLRAGRCAACHQLPVAAWPSPDLTRSRGAIRPGWVTTLLTSGNDHHPHPDFGFTVKQAKDIESYLLIAGDELKLPDAKPTDGTAGQKLVESLGCLACHRVEDVGAIGPRSGGDLSAISLKRPPGYVAQWLKNADTIQPDRRMPTFELAPEEIASIAGYLTSLRPEPKEELVTGDPVAGRKLAQQHRCAQCHAIKELSAEKTWSLNATSPGCMAEPIATTRQPGYRWSPMKQKRVLDYLRQVRVDELPVSVDQRGSEILARHNCMGCHARDNGVGLREILTELGTTDGREQAVRSAPTLQSVGDKLTDEWLSRAVVGDAPRLRGWLSPRMPHFRMSPRDREDLGEYFRTHDRVPAHSPVKIDRPKEEQLVAAQRLVGPAGFGCMSCHQVGKHVPTGSEPSARGPDLAGLGERVRYEWYRRWTRNPARIAGGVEMPAINLASPGLLGDDLETQLSALWLGLNTPGFQVPALQAVQSLSAIHADRPIVLRDLIEHGPKNTTPRPMAIGLTNGHSLLLDLDRMNLRRWWLGDFAQEQTRGKSWFWNLAGTTLLDQPDARSLFAWSIDNQWVGIQGESSPSARLAGWRHEDHAVILAIAIGDKGRVSCRVEQIERGIRMTFSSEDIPLRESLAIILPQEASFSTPAGPAHQTVTGGKSWNESLEGRSYSGRLLSEKVRIDWQLQKPIEPVTAFKPPLPASLPRAKQLPAIPGYEVDRLALEDGPMPTAMAVRADGSLLVASLKGGVFTLTDQDHDGKLDSYRPYSDHLSAPFGLLGDPRGVLVIHKQELLKLIDSDGDDFAERADVIASGWGVTADYHDWIVGPVPDGAGQFYLAASCQQDRRSRPSTVGRGKLLRTTKQGGVEIVADGLRFPMGLVANERGDLFASDNQGVTNPFNEINHLRPGKHYGFFNAMEKRQPGQAIEGPAIDIPHPWTGSVNGLSFIPSTASFGPFAGQMIGAEYTTRRLIRISLQAVGDTFQGCVYPMGEADQGVIERDETFLGPISLAFAPDGTLYVGSMIDSGWGGGNNRGAIEQVRFSGKIPFGIREVRAWAEGFDIDLTQPAEPASASSTSSYSVASYTRVPKGGYATPDSDRRALSVRHAELSPDGQSVRLRVEPLRPGFVHEISIPGLRPAHPGEKIYPTIAYFSLRQKSAP
jgi:mono/diheme cytochrome c family protein/glucose/arabinose dehydrogenase